ncbi:helix-turn-helix domain-containing protein [Actinocrispum sp. NPDC049592]|uniref:winged helix-turn-helix transcriptional regulator n=1 Tax=Actinocrispum sp. NPDC049592 TaxID=3154835 RepID=UPI00343FDA6C
MAHDDCASADAALTRAFTILGTRWTAMLLGVLGRGPAGYRELSRALGKVSDSVLSERLTTLTESGLVSRTVQEGPPITVTYRLTTAGEALMPVLDQISAWADHHLPEPAHSRQP